MEGGEAKLEQTALKHLWSDECRTTQTPHSTNPAQIQYSETRPGINHRLFWINDYCLAKI